MITAGHCLPFLPPSHGWPYEHERLYQNLLGPLAAEKPTVWAECLFVDPIKDIAVLGTPDGQSLPDQWDAYDGFVEGIAPLSVRLCQRGDLAKGGEQAWLLALDGKRWFNCEARGEARLWLESMAEPTVGGMSGSPIVGSDGKAIGVCCIGSEHEGLDLKTHIEGPNPGVLALPGWLLRELGIAV